jgi:hypothetical protein
MTNVPSNARTTIKEVQGTDIIKLLVPVKDCKKHGALAKERYALYKDGMTVNAYREAVKQHVAKLAKANPDKKYIDYGRGDLQNDMYATRQFIAIVPAK